MVLYSDTVESRVIGDRFLKRWLLFVTIVTDIMA
jgi:hypothetical protein